MLVKLDVTKINKFECPMPIEIFRKLYRQRALQYEDAQLLCTIIKKLRPLDILELGTFIGLSAKVMNMALRENGYGNIISVDLWSQGEMFAGPGSPKMGQVFTPEDLKNISLVTSDEIEYLESLPAQCFDMIFEDTNHAARMLMKAVPLIERALRPGGIALFHNSDWESVRMGMDLADVSDRIIDLSKYSNAKILMLRKE